MVDILFLQFKLSQLFAQIYVCVSEKYRVPSELFPSLFAFNSTRSPSQDTGIGQPERQAFGQLHSITGGNYLGLHSQLVHELKVSTLFLNHE